MVRRSWAIASYRLDEVGNRIYVPFTDERVAAINLQFASKAIDSVAAKILLNEIIDSYYRANNVHELIFKRQTLSAENNNLLNKFWNDKYAEKLLIDERSAKDDFVRAFKLIGEASLYTATAKELTAELKVRAKSASQHRRAAERLNEILKYLKRDVRLAKPAEEFKIVKYLNETDVFRLAEQAPTSELKSLAVALFGTGARLGEALAFSETVIGRGDIYIEKQLRPDGTLAPPKRNKRGVVPIIPSTYKHVVAWSKLTDKGAYRDRVYNFVTSASRLLWPNDKSKWISPHDLRHSYAIHCLSKGHSLGVVANSLRNRIEVCQKYYTGYAHNTETLDAAKKLLAR